MVLLGQVKLLASSYMLRYLRPARWKVSWLTWGTRDKQEGVSLILGH
jgi:hypothetical protein